MMPDAVRQQHDAAVPLLIAAGISLVLIFVGVWIRRIREYEARLKADLKRSANGDWL